MRTQRLITIFGITGTQGRSVTLSLLSSTASAFKVRGITRNPDSASAKTLTDSGAEIVKADSFKKSDLVEAFLDSWADFVNTNTHVPEVEGKHAIISELD